MVELKSPKRKIKQCVDCGVDCTGTRCKACFSKHYPSLWTPEKRKEQARKCRGFFNWTQSRSQKDWTKSERDEYSLKHQRAYFHRRSPAMVVEMVDEELLNSSMTRALYFQQKYPNGVV